MTQFTDQLSSVRLVSYGRADRKWLVQAFLIFIIKFSQSYSTWVWIRCQEYLFRWFQRRESCTVMAGLQVNWKLFICYQIFQSSDLLSKFPDYIILNYRTKIIFPNKLGTDLENLLYKKIKRIFGLPYSKIHKNSFWIMIQKKNSFQNCKFINIIHHWIKQGENYLQGNQKCI